MCWSSKPRLSCEISQDIHCWKWELSESPYYILKNTFNGPFQRKRVFTILVRQSRTKSFLFSQSLFLKTSSIACLLQNIMEWTVDCTPDKSHKEKNSTILRNYWRFSRCSRQSKNLWTVRWIYGGRLTWWCKSSCR